MTHAMTPLATAPSARNEASNGGNVHTLLLYSELANETCSTVHVDCTQSNAHGTAAMRPHQNR